ncbi:MAG TPA: type I glyceraldehyde-3-phosphate dehydrogenase [Candidatus Bathyarchaeia archaeon]|nr:type I glyceraldehyde-3-phosphate dehydrogenase [Candidatus Bathyarchaeia archaeon]
MIKVGINGFGRIGRLAARIILQDYRDKIDLVCINTSGKIDTSGWAHLFKYDSSYAQYPAKVEVRGEAMVVDGVAIPILGERKPAHIPWGRYGVQIVIESTGVFCDAQGAKQHLRDSVKKVIITAPPKDEQTPIYVIGVNENNIGNEPVLSSASCTTNCVAPVVKVVEKNFGIVKALMTTIHAYTSDQELLDGSHKDLRRARAAAINIVPTTTGAAKATAKVYPQVKDIFDGLAIRVPVATGSLTDLTFVTKRKISVDEVNEAFKKAAATELKDILGVTEEPIVSSDIIGLKLSCLVDLSLTKVVAQDLLQVIAWYDNEWGYSQRLVEQVLLVAKQLS